MKKVLYAKYANTRLPKFKICTKYIIENNKKTFVKSALCEQAIPHVKSIYSNYNKLLELYKESDIIPVPCRFDADINEIEFDFISGKTLDEIMFDNIIANKADLINEQLIKYYNLINNAAAKKEFVPSEKFKTVFGDFKFQRSLESYEFCNLDINPDNIIINEDGKTLLIDYEWCFDFDVPIKYTIYRSINNFLEIHNLPKTDIFNIIDIDSCEQKIFDEMENNFLQYVLGNEITKNATFNASMLKQKFNVLKHCDNPELLQPHESNLFYDLGEGYSELNKITARNVEIAKGEYKVIFNLPANEDVLNFRFDPIENIASKIKIISAKVDEFQVKLLPTNETSIVDDWVVFEHIDPIFVFKLEELNVKKFKVVIIIYKIEFLNLQEITIKLHNNSIGTHKKQEELEKNIIILEDKHKVLEKAHNEVVNSFFWKATWPLRRFFAIFKR